VEGWRVLLRGTSGADGGRRGLHPRRGAASGCCGAFSTAYILVRSRLLAPVHGLEMHQPRWPAPLVGGSMHGAPFLQQSVAARDLACLGVTCPCTAARRQNCFYSAQQCA